MADKWQQEPFDWAKMSLVEKAIWFPARCVTEIITTPMRVVSWVFSSVCAVFSPAANILAAGISYANSGIRGVLLLLESVIEFAITCLSPVVIIAWVLFLYIGLPIGAVYVIYLNLPTGQRVAETLNSAVNSGKAMFADDAEFVCAYKADSFFNKTIRFSIGEGTVTVRNPEGDKVIKARVIDLPNFKMSSFEDVREGQFYRFDFYQETFSLTAERFDRDRAGWMPIREISMCEKM